MSPVSFKIFLSLWNRVQEGATPAVHFMMADWLETAWREGRKRLLLQAFRSGGKSTIAGMFAMWLLYCNPDLRIMVLSADGLLARKMVWNVRRILERHPLTRHLKPQRPDQWAADRFTVNRRAEWRDPSMLARGVTANITGSRADVIICDDVEVPKTCDTAEKRTALRERLGEIDFVLTPGGTVIYIGTPHAWHSLYSETPHPEAGEEKPFLEGYDRLTIPVIDEAGISAWPERFPAGSIERMRLHAGPNRFASQMLLRPVNFAEGRLDADDLRFYDGKLHISAELGGLYLDGKRIMHCGAWWDPSLAKAGGDASVLAVAFRDEDGRILLHHVEYIRFDPSGTDENLDQQCRKAAVVLQLLRVPSVTIEMNGIGAHVPGALRTALAKDRVACAVREANTSRAKDVRILEAFDALLAARALHVHESVRKTPFIAEMREWRPGVKGLRDDGLDAVAGALSLLPGHVAHERFEGRQTWMGSGRVYEAKTEFDP